MAKPASKKDMNHDTDVMPPQDSSTPQTDSNDATLTESNFIEKLKNEGVEYIEEFKEQVLNILSCNGNRSITMRDLFKGSALNSHQQKFLKSLRKNHIARPQGGGPWTADRPIVLTNKGLELLRSSSNVQPRPLIFVSYSRKDQVWRERLVEHLAVLEQGFQLDLWYDKRVGMGSEWFTEIKDALERATAAVLLISASFLGSEFIKNEEVPQMLDRVGDGFQVFPILVRPCAWQTVDWLRRLQIRPSDGQALLSDSEYQIDEHLAQITLEISELLRKTSNQIHSS